MIPTGFQSFSEYGKFVWAREFRDVQTQEKILYAKTRLERFGDGLAYPIMRVADHSMRNIRNPVMIFSVASTCIVAVTILFYPAELIQIVTRVIPMAKKIQPWMIKVALYTVLQTTILGVGLRTLGRLDPSGALWNAWNHFPRQILPVAIGTQVIRR